MSDSAVPITSGTGTNIDTRTEATNGNHRQVVVLGDPATNAGVAPVDATKGLAVDLSATGANTNKLLVTPDLPALAATSTKQSDGSQKTQVVDGAGNVIGATSNALDINIKSGNPTTITATQGTGSNLHTVVDSGTITTVSTLTGTTTLTPGTGATNLGKAEDAAHTTGDVGVMGLTVRQDTAAALAGTDGDYQPPITDASGRMHVNVGTSVLPTGAATAAKQPALGTAGTASSDVITVQGVAAMTALKTDGSGVTQPVSGTVTANLGTAGTAGTSVGKAEDATHTSGDTGVMALGVRNDAGTALAGTDGDYIPLSTDANGALRVTGGGGGTQYLEDAASAGGETMTLAGAVRQDTITSNTSLDGDYTYLKTTNTGRLYTSAAIDTALPAGANAIGKLAANDGVDIGDVTVNNASGASAVNVQDGGNSLTVDYATTGSGTATGALRVELPTNGTGVVGLNAGSSIIGKVTTDQTTHGTTDLVAADITKLAGTAVDTNSGVKSAGTMRVVLATDQPQLTNTLKVDGSAVTQPVAGTKTNNNAAPGATNVGALTALANASAPSWAEGNLVALSTDLSGALRTSSSVTPASDVTASASLSATGSATTATLNGAATATVYISGTWSATVQFEGSTDGTNYYSVNATPVTGGAPVTSTAANGQWQVSTGGLANLRARVSAYTSGTVVIAVRSSIGAGVVSVGINNASGASAVNVQDGGNSLTVDNGGTFAVQATVAAGATNIAKAEDVASADGDVGVPAFAVRKATPANTSGTDGDYEALQISAGRLWTSSTIDAALPAGTNGIGKLTSNSGVTIGAVEIAASQTLSTVTNVATIGTSVTPGTSAAHLGKAEDAVHGSGDTGVMALGVGNVAQTTLAADGDYIPLATDIKGNLLNTGNIAHDGVDAGNPIKVGQKAVAHGANPTAVAAGDRTDWYANRAGVPFIIGGHPNVVSFEAAYTAAQTDTAIVTIAGGLKIVVTEIEAICDYSNTVKVGVRVGFGTVNTPTTTGVVLTHPGIAPGSGIVRGNGGGILGVGGDGEDIRITCDVPTSGSIRVLVTYYTIES